MDEVLARAREREEEKNAKVTKKQCERTDGTKGSRIRRNEREREKKGERAGERVRRKWKQRSKHGGIRPP